MKFILFLFFLSFSGCSSYHSGIGPEVLAHSIYIEPVKNNSLCPKAGPLTGQIIKEIQSSTRLKSVQKNEAQLYLQVEIVDFSQNNSAFDPKDSSLVLSLNLHMVVECTLIDKNGQVLLEHQRVEVSMDLGKEKKFHSLRDQAIPQLMKRLARKICALLVNIW